MFAGQKLPVLEEKIGIDRIIFDIETGRFERALSALSALSSLVSMVEIYFEHDKASFGNKNMWLPVLISPVGAITGIAGVFSRRLAKTALPLAGGAMVINGIQGIYLHARGISQKPGGFRNFRYNMEMGPPLMGPLMMVMVGGMAILAALLRREQ